MKAGRWRWAWYGLPLLALAFLLRPVPDDLAPLRKGHPLDFDRVASRQGPWLRSDADLFRSEAAYGFDRDMTREFLACVPAAQGWSKRSEYHVNAEDAYFEHVPPFDGLGYAERVTGDQALLIRYERPEDGYRDVVVLRERREVWPRLRRRLGGPFTR